MQNTQFEPNHTDIGSAELIQRVSELERIVEEKTLELERRNQEVKGIFDALNMLQGELLQAQKLESIGRLASGVAHEINSQTIATVATAHPKMAAHTTKAIAALMTATPTARRRSRQASSLRCQAKPSRSR